MIGRVEDYCVVDGVLLRITTPTGVVEQ